MTENKRKRKLSLVIPCLNEEETIGMVVKKGRTSLKKLGIDGEVVVSDNGSIDKSEAIARREGARVVNCPKKGYGNALRFGFEEAKGEFIIMGDADDSYDFSDIKAFIEKLDEGYDLVMGTRLKGKIEKGAMPFLHRYLGTPVLTFVLNLFFGTRISDCNCGMRAFTKKAWRKMNLNSEGMELASEMIIKAGILNLSIKEIPIKFYKDKRKKPPHLRSWRDGWRHLRYMLLFSPNYLFLVPGGVLVGLGLGMLVALLFNSITILGHTLGYHFALLASLFSILGFQLFSMGIYAKAYAFNQELKAQDRFINKFYKVFTLEKGLALGILLFLSGFVVDAIVLKEWLDKDFGALSRAVEVTFASTLIVIGIQIFFSSFFISFTGAEKEKIKNNKSL
ncbi:MAG: glycosyltransferase family 2 protein [Patescibacteria group bacterium]